MGLFARTGLHAQEDVLLALWQLGEILIEDGLAAAVALRFEFFQNPYARELWRLFQDAVNERFESIEFGGTRLRLVLKLEKIFRANGAAHGFAVQTQLAGHGGDGDPFMQMHAANVGPSFDGDHEPCSRRLKISESA